MKIPHFARSARGFLAAVTASVVAAGAAGNLGCSKSPGAKPAVQRADAIPVEVAEVKLVPLDQTLEVVGTLFPQNEATVGARVEGQVQETRVDFGDRVEAGQEIALIDTESYEALAAQAAANVAKAKANLQNAEANLNRVRALQQQNISSASEFDTATAQAEQARAELKAMEAAENVAKLNLARSRVRAPFSGGIAERIANAGDYVKTGTPLFRLVNDSELKFVVQAPERYAGLVAKDQVVEFSVDAFPGEIFQGKIYLVSPAIDTATRSFNVAAMVPNASGKLKANTFARGELILQRQVETPVIPLEAVVSFAGVTKAFVIENNAARSRAIKTGRVRGAYQEVLDGLKPGETVAVSGTSKLFEDAKVRLIDSADAKPQTAAQLQLPQRATALR